MALESAWELYLPTLGPEGRYPGSASPTQAGKGGPSMMLTPRARDKQGDGAERGADRRTRKREGERGGEDSQETPSGSCRPLTLTRRQDRHQEWLGFVQLSQYFR